jgi:hypothetical protein
MVDAPQWTMSGDDAAAIAETRKRSHMCGFLFALLSTRRALRVCGSHLSLLFFSSGHAFASLSAISCQGISASISQPQFYRYVGLDCLNPRPDLFRHRVFPHASHSARELLIARGLCFDQLDSFFAVPTEQTFKGTGGDVAEIGVVKGLSDRFQHHLPLVFGR